LDERGLSVRFTPPISSELALQIWAIASDDSEKKLPTASYVSSLSSHSSAVNVLRFSPSGRWQRCFESVPPSEHCTAALGNSSPFEQLHLHMFFTCLAHSKNNQFSSLALSN
jgi:hypothetical protein